LAAKLFRLACAHAYAPGCSHLGELYRDGRGVRQSREAAASWAAEGCEGGDAPGCAALGNYYLAGSGVVRDEARGQELIDRAWKACDLGDAEACRTLGRTRKSH